MPRQSFRKSGADLKADRCRKNLDLLGKLSDRMYAEQGTDSGDKMLVYHLLLCRLCPLVPVSAFKEAMDEVIRERFKESSHA